MITEFRIFESKELWNDFINKVNTGILPKDLPDVKNIDKLSSLIPSKSKVLDISIGDGAHSEYLIEKGFDVYGTDISDLAINTMKEKYPEQTWIVHDTLEKFPFSNNFFDLVFARLALHYFKKEEVDKVLIDIKRILKPNGYFFMMVKTSGTGNLSTGKILYTDEEWLNMISCHLQVIKYESFYKKAYSFEKDSSNLFQLIAKK